MSKSRIYMCRPPLPPRARGVDCNICLRLQHNGRRHNKTKTRESTRKTTQRYNKTKTREVYTKDNTKIQQDEDQKSLHKRQDKPTNIPVPLQEKDSILRKIFFLKATNPKGGTPGRGVLLFRGCGTSPR